MKTLVEWKRKFHNSSRNPKGHGIQGFPSLPAVLAFCLSLLSLPLSPLHSDNTGAISLSITLVAGPVTAPELRLGPDLRGSVHYQDYLSVPLDVQFAVPLDVTNPAAQTAIQSGVIQRVTLHYRKQGETQYQTATGAQAFKPDPTGKSTYKGRAIIPGAWLKDGVEYYIEVDRANGETLRRGSAAVPLSTRYSGEDYVVQVQGGDQAVLPDGDEGDGNTQVVFPTGSVGRPLEVRMRQLGVEDRGGLRAGNPLEEWVGSSVPVAVYRLEAPVVRFQKPVTLTLKYADVDDAPGKVDGTEIQEKDLKLFWWDGFTWRLMGGTVNASSNTVTGTVTHFSVYALFPAGALTPKSFRPLEKILSPNGDGINDVATFGGLSGVYEIKIFDTTGREIRRITEVPEWDGRDDKGNVVENGAYLYQYRTDNSNDWVSGMLGVVQ